MTLAETLAALHAASFKTAWSVADFEAFLQNAFVRVVTSDHGLALIQTIPPEAELLTLSILPQARGNGHGRALLEATLTEARAAGATSMFLEVDADNSAAIALYTSKGFTRTGLRKGYYAHDDGTRTDAVTMTLALEPGS